LVACCIQKARDRLKDPGIIIHKKSGKTRFTHYAHLTKENLISWSWWRQLKYSHGPFTHVVLKRKRAAVELHDRSADRKTKPKTSLFCREEWLENALFLGWWQPCTTIRYPHFDSALIGRGGVDRNGALRRGHTIHCIHGVHEKIEKDLLQLNRVAMRRRQVDVFFVVDRNSTVYQFAMQEPKS